MDTKASKAPHPLGLDATPVSKESPVGGKLLHAVWQPGTPQADAHIHLDFMANGEAVAADAAKASVKLFAGTVTPDGFHSARTRFQAFQNVAVGLGFHPWWIEDGSNAEAFLRHLDETWLVSEVGLDFGKRHQATRDVQRAVFTRIAHACAEAGGKVLSIHSVHAAREVLDVLEKSGAVTECTCIFHWYSGPSDQLKRAIEAGCYFSVGERMLATKRGREYVKVIPANRLLLESDAPPEQGQAYSFDELRASLARADEGIRIIKGEQRGEA